MGPAGQSGLPKPLTEKDFRESGSRLNARSDLPLTDDVREDPQKTRAKDAQGAWPDGRRPKFEGLEEVEVPSSTDARVAAQSGEASRSASGEGAESLAGSSRSDDDEMGADLLLRFQLGEREAFEEIVGRFEAPLTRFFFRLCWDRDRAEDFAQDVFLKLLRASDSYEPRGRLSTYVYRIATNRWIDHYRSLRPRPALYSLDRASQEEEQPILDRLAAPIVDQGEQIDEDLQKRRLREALSRLSLPHRLVFELAVYQALPYQQISELLGIPEGTVKSRMHNATRALKELMAEPSEDSQSSSGSEAPPLSRARRRGGHRSA